MGTTLQKKKRRKKYKSIEILTEYKPAKFNMLLTDGLKLQIVFYLQKNIHCIWLWVAELSQNFYEKT